MGYGLDNWDSIPGRGQKFFCTAFRPALGLTQFPTQRVPGSLSRRLKRPGPEADGSPPSSAEAKNDGATPPLPIYFHGVMLN
jgi:hypothetical protein